MLEFKEGKCYRMRNGNKATILDIDYKNMSGCTEDDEYCTTNWNLDGSRYDNEKSEYDLVAEWEEEQPKLKFEAGKSYRTRDGEKVEVCRIDKYSIYGRMIYDSHERNWHLPHGNYVLYGESAFDLVAEWEEEQPRLTFEEGKSYRTRDYNRVIVDRIDEDSIDGRIIYETDRRFWKPNGKYVGIDTCIDLVAEWSDDDLKYRCNYEASLILSNSLKSSFKPTINSPAHYTAGGMEVIDQMEKLFGIDAVKSFCLLNAYKYRMRAGIKTDDPAEDISKARWYENKLKELEGK